MNWLDIVMMVCAAIVIVSAYVLAVLVLIFLFATLIRICVKQW